MADEKEASHGVTVPDPETEVWRSPRNLRLWLLFVCSRRLGKPQALAGTRFPVQPSTKSLLKQFVAMGLHSQTLSRTAACGATANPSLAKLQWAMVTRSRFCRQFRAGSDE